MTGHPTLLWWPKRKMSTCLFVSKVLGISSKRLHSILDGYACPSNTDSSEESSTEALETISLDSISSDDEILSHQDQKSKKKVMLFIIVLIL